MDETLLASAILSGPDAIIAADRDGVIAFWNAGAERMFGFTEAHALGQTLDLIIPERLRERHWAGWRQTIGQRSQSLQRRGTAGRTRGAPRRGDDLGGVHHPPTPRSRS
jgi:PAS domain S-box-containing protein